MKKILILSSLGLIFAVTEVRHAIAAYFDEASWRSAAGASNPNSPLVHEMPGYTITIRDAYGIYTPETRNEPVYAGRGWPVESYGSVWTPRWTPQNVSSPGSMSGNFECHSAYYPCLGAYEITYHFPHKIRGLAGDLSFYTGYYEYWSTLAEIIPFFPLPDVSLEELASNGFIYSGYFGALFQPTDTLSILWPMGQWSADNHVWFLLSNAVVLAAPGQVAVPEPSALTLLGVMLVGLFVASRRFPSTRIKDV